jgi:molybdopterin molybdotransferase
MLTIEEAQARILSSVPAMPVERVALGEAYGRYLAEDVRSPRDVPPWDNSAMDGYAVRAADTGDEVRLRINEVVGAGGWPKLRVEPGTATAIMTGAPMPEGADAVVMVEDTDGAREGAVVIRGRAEAGQHVRRRGDDVKTSDLVLARGLRLGAAHVGLAASLGIAELPVAKRPVVAILSTGDEVVPPGQELQPGQIYSSNNAAIAGLVLAAGAVPKDMGIAKDSLEATIAGLRACLEAGADVVVTTGGVSVGAFDYVKDAFAAVGGAIDFWKVRMKPGKPLAFGRIGASGDGARGQGAVPLFGLPGNPVSCMVNFFQFVRPHLLTSMGAAKPWLPVVDAIAEQPIRDHGGRYSLVRVSLAWRDGAIRCRTTGSQSSGVLTSMGRAHGFALLGPERTLVDVGQSVRVQLIDASFLDGEAAGYGW